MSSNPSAKPLIAVDAMGGDNAPLVPVVGSLRALEHCPDLSLALYGDEAQITPLLADHPESLRQRVSIHHCTDVILADDKPSTTIRRGQNSSMNLAILAAKSGACTAAVSAGNTGALMALALYALRCLPGIERPALGCGIPTMSGASCILDLGANLHCSTENLVQFALMGRAFFEVFLGHTNPSVGLLNIGTEEKKGPDSVRHAHEILRESHLNLNYKGYIEGSTLLKGTTDVVVCEGFGGNIALKTAEGVYGLLRQKVNEAFAGSLRGKIGGLLMRHPLKHALKPFDPVRLEGAVLLGLTRTVVKAHGGTNADGFCYALRNTVAMGDNRLEQKITEQFDRFNADRQQGSPTE